MGHDKRFRKRRDYTEVLARRDTAQRNSIERRDHMQEEIENRAVILIISGSKLTGRVLKAAFQKYLARQKALKQKLEAAKDVKPQGKQTVKELIGQNAGVANIEITDKNIRSFDRVARKYGVDYAVKKDRSTSPPKYLVFFKARDADALTAAFTEYSKKAVKRETERPSVLDKLRSFVALARDKAIERTRHKDKGLEL